MMMMTLREARAQVGWTQERLALETGLRQGYISKIESGVISQPGYRTVRTIESALGLSPGTLVFGHPDGERAIAS